MRTIILSLLITIGSAASAQNILDSIQLYEYPVRQGVIYKYENKSSPTQVCATSLSIVSVVTPTDSVFHFENGKVTSVFPVDDFYGIIVANDKGESITYSNLKKVNLKKGDAVIRGMCIGTSAECEDLEPGLNQVDILILRNIKALPYYKTVEYIRSKMSTGSANKKFYSRL